jgi:ABC transporter substrate binding protein
VIRWATGTFELDDNFVLLTYLTAHPYNLCFYFRQALLKRSVIRGTSHNTTRALLPASTVRIMARMSRNELWVILADDVIEKSSVLTSGGLLSYGNDSNDSFRRAAAYADRILRGDKPSELPVQAPVKFQLVINLKTATLLHLTVPTSLIVAAEEVIE